MPRRVRGSMANDREDGMNARIRVIRKWLDDLVTRDAQRWVMAAFQWWMERARWRMSIAQPPGGLYVCSSSLRTCRLADRMGGSSGVQPW